MYSHCTTGGWILGNTIDGTQAEFVRMPYADTSLYPIPEAADEEALVMLSDILPTGFECGVLNGKVAPGSTVAIVGAGPIGLAALLTAQFYSHLRTVSKTCRGRWPHRQYRGARKEGRPPSGAAMGPQYFHHHAARRHRHHTDAVQDRGFEKDRPQAAHHASLQAR